jgi:hypothetical protein
MKLKNILYEVLLTERGIFSRSARIIAGTVPGIDSYALLSPENPYGEQYGTEENAEFRERLEDELRKSGFGFIKVKGKFFGNVEHSYLIPKMSQEDAIAVGKQFGQFSVIHGSKDPASNNMIHKYIEGDEVTQTRKTFTQLAKDTEDMYSTVQGRKFKIPFFDPTAKDKDVVGGKIVPGSKDIERYASPESEKNREQEKQKMRSKFTPLTNPEGRKVWVYKKNSPKYLKMGYKKEPTNGQKNVGI